mmetsp:Transcript_83527/g.233080  ORF Transcript_83527/g.233080 Transcript_83527/m.233080 type:complete len:265 (+) Transcript_83527:715-1509(+)
MGDPHLRAAFLPQRKRTVVDRLPVGARAERVDADVGTTIHRPLKKAEQLPPTFRDDGLADEVGGRSVRFISAPGALATLATDVEEFFAYAVDVASDHVRQSDAGVGQLDCDVAVSAAHQRGEAEEDAVSDRGRAQDTLVTHPSQVHTVIRVHHTDNVIEKLGPPPSVVIPAQVFGLLEDEDVARRVPKGLRAIALREDAPHSLLVGGVVPAQLQRQLFDVHVHVFITPLADVSLLLLSVLEGLLDIKEEPFLVFRVHPWQDKNH